MDFPTSEVGHTSTTTGRGGHEVRKGHVVALGGNTIIWSTWDNYFRVQTYFTGHCMSLWCRFWHTANWMINPFRSYVELLPTLRFSCFLRFSWYITLSNPIFLPPAYSPALIYFGRERGWWVTCYYPTVLKEKNINRNRKSTTCTICWLKSVLHEEKREEQENHNVGLMIFLFPTFPHIVWTLANR
jgi:hypothetical protein